MTPLAKFDALPNRELNDLLAPIFSYTLDEAPVAEREALIDRICDVLLVELGSKRVSGGSVAP